jgi:COP9 signalosome complex subunit 1
MTSVDTCYSKWIRILRLGDRRPVLDLIKQHTLNSALYEAIAHKQQSTPLDQKWIDHVNETYLTQLDALNGELEKRKRTMVKTSIALGLVDLGMLHMDRGEYNHALVKFLNAKDQGLEKNDVMNVAWMVIQASICLGNLAHVHSTATRILNSKEIQEFPEYAVKFNVAIGVYHLRQGSFESAIHSFVKAVSVAPKKLQYMNLDLATANEIAVYCGVAALAIFDRQQLKSQVIDDSAFRSILECEPWLNTAVQHFYQTKYSRTIQALEDKKKELFTEYFIGPHLFQLIKRIRNRAMVQYMKPYKSVNLYTMASAFHVDPVHFESDIAQLIQDGEINFRIDTTEKILWQNDIDTRKKAFSRAQKLASEFSFNSRCSLLRMQLIKNDISVPKPSQKSDRRMMRDLYPEELFRRAF